MAFVRETGMPVPRCFMTTAETALNLETAEDLHRGTLSIWTGSGRYRSESGNWSRRTWMTVALEFIIRRRLEEAMMALCWRSRKSLQLLTEVLLMVEAITALPLKVNLWQTQNLYWTMLNARTWVNSELLTSGEGGRGPEQGDPNRRPAAALFNVPARAGSAEGES
jgi:hypothetical protein